MIFLLCLAAMYLLQECVTQEFYVCGVKGRDDKQCERINSLKSKLGCELFESRLACLKNMSQPGGPVMFGRMTPDEAVFVNKFFENIEVIAEIRPFQARVNQSEEYSLVTITKNNIENLEKLRNKSYCHPGFGKWMIPRSALTHVERTISKYINNTFSEDEVYPISDVCRLTSFFEKICRPDSLRYEDFTNKDICNFDNLCNLCNFNKECSTIELSKGFEASMDCFINGGDIAVTTLEAVQLNNMTDKVRYVCNGNLGDEICTSYKRYWPMIVSNSNHRDPVVDYLEELFNEKLLQPPRRSRRLNYQIQNPSFKILLTDVFDRILINYDRKNLWNFINEQHQRTPVPNNLRWCVTSEKELDECDWWKLAMSYEDLYPNIDCIYKKDERACIDAVNNESADLVAVGETLRCVAESKGLKTLAEFVPGSAVKSVVVVEDNTSINSWSDLLGKPACMVKFGDAASTSFLSVLRENNEQNVNITHGTCNATLYNATFEHEKCNHYVEEVCSSMQETGSANEALQCLTKTKGYAVLENQGITVDTSKYHVICKNKTLAEDSGLDVDDQCYLPYMGFLMVKTRKKRLENFLKLLQEVFRQSSVNPVKVFGRSLNGKDLIIKDEVIGFRFLKDKEEDKNLENTTERHEERNNAVNFKKFLPSYLLSIIVVNKVL